MKNQILIGERRTVLTDEDAPATKEASAQDWRQGSLVSTAAKVTLADGRRPFADRLVEGVARLFSPLL